MWFLNRLSAPCIRKSEIKCMHGRNVPADESRLHPFTRYPYLFFRVTSHSDARGNGGRRDSQQHPLIGGYRRHWSGSGLDPASHTCVLSLKCAYASSQAWTRIASPESFTTSRRFQSLELNWTWDRSSQPILHLKLLLKSINIHPGSAILPNNLSSLANPLSYLCSTQFSTEQFTTETNLTCSTEFLYAYTCTSGKACDIAGPYTTVTKSLSPKTRASGSIRIITARSVSRGIPHTVYTQ